jgi:hypothetical protein
MSKIEINQVAEILKKNKADPKLLRSVIEEMNLLAQAAQEADEDKPKPVKKQNVILISDPDGLLLEQDLVGWVLQIPDYESPVTTLDRIYRSTHEFNASKKGRLYPAKTVGEAIENVPAKIFNEAGVWVKTKIPVLALRTNNLIPRQ